MKKHRVLWLLLFYGLIVVAGSLLGEFIGRDFDASLMAHNEPAVHRAVILAFVAYILLTALPFVPGVEIGMAIILLFGPPIVPLVYLSSITSLTLSYAVGRLLPESLLIRLFRFLGLQRAAGLVSDLQPMSPQQRVEYLVEKAPRAWIPWLLKHRYLALAVLINLPGSALLGGGGGICMASGMSRLFTPVRYLLLVAIAVSPVPISILLGSRLGLGFGG